MKIRWKTRAKLYSLLLNPHADCCLSRYRVNILAQRSVVAMAIHSATHDLELGAHVSKDRRRVNRFEGSTDDYRNCHTVLVVLMMVESSAKYARKASATSRKTLVECRRLTRRHSQEFPALHRGEDGRDLCVCVCSVVGALRDHTTERLCKSVLRVVLATTPQMHDGAQSGDMSVHACSLRCTAIPPPAMTSQSRGLTDTHTSCVEHTRNPWSSKDQITTENKSQSEIRHRVETGDWPLHRKHSTLEHTTTCALAAHRVF